VNIRLIRNLQKTFYVSLLAVTSVAVDADKQIALAQETAANALEEVIVTARKREESLMEIPVAVTVFTADALARIGAMGLEDISYSTPGLQFHSQGGAFPGRMRTGIRFRGMDPGSGNITSPSQQIGTAFIDGVYIASGVQSLSFLGVERVEVIRGPQSALFGRSTFGGAISYVTSNPSTTEYSGQVEGMIAQDGLYDFSVSHEGPIIPDKLSYRIGVRGFGDGGQYTSIRDGGDLGEERSETLVASIYATPTEQFSARANVMYQRDEDGPPSGFLIGNGVTNFYNGPDLANCFDVRPELIGAVNPFNGRPVTEYFCGALPDVNDDLFTGTQTSLPSAIRDLLVNPPGLALPDVPHVSGMGLARTNTVVSLIADYTFDSGPLAGATLTSLSGYNEVATNWIHDFDMTPAASALSLDPELYETYSTELQLASDPDKRFRWMVGFNYFHAEFTRQGGGGMAIFNPESNPNYTLSGAPFPFPLPISQLFSEEGGKTIAAFGSFSYDINDQFTIDAEWRWQDDEVSSTPLSNSGEAVETLSQSFSNFLPRVTLNYKPVDKRLLWATYAKGNVPGFFNTDFVGLTDDQKQDVIDQTGQAATFLEEEELDNYEIGWRESFNNNRVSFSLVGYYMEWTNRKTQVPVFLSSPTPGGVTSLNVRINSGDTDLWGLEFESYAQITDRLAATASLGWAKSELVDFFCVYSAQFAGTTDCSGNESPRFPELSGAFALDWQDRLTDQWDYFSRMDGIYFGEAYVDETNFAHTEAYWKFNLRAGVQRDDLRLEVFVTNLFNQDKYEAAGRFSNFSGLDLFDFSNNQGVIVTPPEKRRIGVRMSYRF
jgi:iron complex outermembrane receptor protein